MWDSPGSVADISVTIKAIFVCGFLSADFVQQYDRKTGDQKFSISNGDLLPEQ